MSVHQAIARLCVSLGGKIAQPDDPIYKSGPRVYFMNQSGKRTKRGPASSRQPTPSGIQPPSTPPPQNLSGMEGMGSAMPSPIAPPTGPIPPPPPRLGTPCALAPLVRWSGCPLQGR
mgnify:CR=1 FL=1